MGRLGVAYTIQIWQEKYIMKKITIRIDGTIRIYGDYISIHTNRLDCAPVRGKQRQMMPESEYSWQVLVYEITPKLTIYSECVERCVERMEI
jgi:hypothetical protein